MKKIFIFTILPILIGGAFAFFYINNEKKIDNQNFEVKCDLNLQDCENDGVKFSFSSRPVYSMVPVLLEISNLQGDFKNLNAKICGINMNMGTIKADFKKVGDNKYRTNVVFSACVVAKMIYRIELFDGEKSIGKFVDFIIKN